MGPLAIAQVIAACINSFGEGSHPMATPENLKFFASRYQRACLRLARCKERDPGRLAVLNQALDQLDSTGGF